MRKTALKALLLAAGVTAATLPLPSHAAEPCAWRNPGKLSRLFLERRVAIFRRYYDAQWASCAAPEGGRVTLEWRTGMDPQAPPVQTDTIELRRGRSDEPYRMQEELYPNHVCEKRSGPRGKLALTGSPGEEQVSELVPVRARLVATGALAPLAFDPPPIEVPCGLCERLGERMLRVQQDHYSGKLTLEAKLDPRWYECARFDATLMLLGFSEERAPGNDVRSAIQPDFVLRDLEKKLTRRGDVVVLDEPLPTARLCATSKQWAFELWGRGELMRAAGGGRTTFTLRCGR
jgi:hypothetical protein